MTCPRCSEEATLEHVRGSAECARAIKSLYGLYCLAKRTTVTHAGGRPPTLVPCPKCGQMVGKTAAKRGHGCQGRAA
jgi:hypothetical protein